MEDMEILEIMEVRKAMTSKKAWAQNDKYRAKENDKRYFQYLYNHDIPTRYSCYIPHKRFSVSATKFYKRQANKKIRRYKGEVANNGWYRKDFDIRWMVI